MTIKEISEFAQCSHETVRIKAKELFPSKFENGKKTVFTQKECFAILQNIRIKGNVATEDLKVAPNNLEETGINTGSSLTSRDLDLISAIVSRTVAMTIQQLDLRMAKIENRIESRSALLPAPHIKPRDNVNKIVREYADKNKFEFRVVWQNLYREFGYRTNTNPKVSAQNRGMSIIDYIEAEGQIETLEAVALDFLRAAQAS